MESFVIEGGQPLHGTVTPSGNKNAALPALAAALLTTDPVVLRNVPDIGDVRSMAALLADAGVDVQKTGERELTLQAGQICRSQLNAELSRVIRASILLAGPMLARCGQVSLPPPGGDVIGRRRVDTHLLALGALGAQISVDDGYHMRTSGLRGSDILLDEASVTGTENAIMGAVLARGTTIIRNAASEPHVQDLCRLLVAMGALIDGIASNTLTIEGVDRLHGAEFTISPDYIEIGSFIGLGAITRGLIRIRGVVPEDLRMIRMGFERLGVWVELEGQDLIVPGGQRLQIWSDVHGAIPKIDDAPWPGFPADLMSIALVVATQATGTILIHEKMFESRLYFVDKLIGMGARIILCDPHRAVIVGPSQLHAEPSGLSSPDIRAGMALLIAALCAEGTSVIRNIGQIDRGYDRIDDKLAALGARIERIAD